MKGKNPKSLLTWRHCWVFGSQRCSPSLAPAALKPTQPSKNLTSQIFPRNPKGFKPLHTTASHPWKGFVFILIQQFSLFPRLHFQIQALPSLPFPLLNPSAGTTPDKTGIKGSGSRFKNLSKVISFPLVIELWNSLSGDVLAARNTCGFKAGLEKLTEDRSTGGC